MRYKPQHVRLVHGEEDARIELAEKIRQLGIAVD